MKNLMALLAFCMGTNAFATTLSCQDTLTFAYGVATVVDDGSGVVRMGLRSSLMFQLIGDIAPDVQHLTNGSINLVFASRDCKALGVCAGAQVKMQYLDGRLSMEKVLDRAEVTIDIRGAELTLTNAGNSASFEIMLNKCEISPSNQP